MSRGDVSWADLMASPTAPCPSCRRPSRLTAIDGRDCLVCAAWKAAGRRIGEAAWTDATDNAGIGSR